MVPGCSVLVKLGECQASAKLLVDILSVNPSPMGSKRGDSFWCGANTRSHGRALKLAPLAVVRSFALKTCNLCSPPPQIFWIWRYFYLSLQANTRETSFKPLNFVNPLFLDRRSILFGKVVGLLKAQWSNLEHVEKIPRIVCSSGLHRTTLVLHCIRSHTMPACDDGCHAISYVDALLAMGGSAPNRAIWCDCDVWFESQIANH